MSSLERVRFSQKREHKPRLSAPYVPGVHSERFWSEAEKKVLIDHAQTRGLDWCKAQLPGRSRGSLYQMCKTLGIKLMPGQRRRRILAERPELDEVIKAAWPELKGKGAVTALAERLGVPRHWLSDRAVKLGLTIPHKKEPEWTEAEVALLRKAPLHDPDRASQFFRAHGFTRSPASIVNKAKRLDISRRYRTTLSATAAARILGVDVKWITARCIDGSIKAVKRPTKRLPQQGGDPWSIERTALRRFIIDRLHEIDLRKVEKFAFVDLLVRTEAPDGGPTDS